MAYEMIVIAIESILVLYLGKFFMDCRRANLHQILDCIKKKTPLFFLETSIDVRCRKPTEMYEGWAFTKYEDIIRTSAGTIKRCPELGGLLIGHGEHYLSTTIPLDVKRYIEYLRGKNLTADEISDEIDNLTKDERLELIDPKWISLQWQNEGKTIEQISEGLKYVETHNTEILNRIAERKKLTETFKRSDGKTIEIFRTISFDNIKDWLNTGCNRTMMKKQLENLINQKKLDKLFGKTNWIAIAGAILLVLIGLGILFQFLGQSGVLTQILGNGAAAAATPTTPGIPLPTK